MDRIHLGTILFLIVILCATLLMFSTSGCKSWGAKPGPLNLNPDTPKERFIQSIKSIGWLLLLSIMGMAVSVFALLNGSRWALSSLGGSGVMMALSLLISRYAEFLALITLLCVLGGIGFFIYSIVVKKKVLVDIVKSVEKVKTQVTPMWDTTVKKELNTQKPATQKVVNKIREKLNGKKK